MSHDSERSSALVTNLRLCTFSQGANKNILTLRDASHCKRATWAQLLNRRDFVTFDVSGQSARIRLPLQNSAVGFDHPSIPGAQSPKLYFGGFFCAFSLAPNGGRAGAPSGAPVPGIRLINPVRSTTPFDHGDGV